MGNDNILTNGVNQVEKSIGGDWDKLKSDTKDFINEIESIINNTPDNNNTKIIGYKNSLGTLKNNIEKFDIEINKKSGIENYDSDEYGYFLECRYLLESKKTESTVLSNTVTVLDMTKEL